MKEPTYRQTLSQAWSLVWQNKLLWILGLLSVFLGQLGFSDMFGRVWSVFDGLLSRQGFSLVPLVEFNLYGSIWDILGLVWLAVICLSVVALLGFLAVVSQGTLIYYAADWFKNGKHKILDRSWGVAVKHFWSIAAVNILKQIVMFCLLALFVFAANRFLTSYSFGSGLLFATMSMIVFLLVLVLSCISVYALCYVVLDGKGLVVSVRKALSLFSEHVLVSLEVGFLLMLINILLVGVILLGSFFTFLPAVIIWVAGGIANLVVFATIGLITGIFLLLLFIATVTGIFNAFTVSAWVFLFMKMHKEGVASRTVHLLRYIFSR